eukprot:UN15999
MCFQNSHFSSFVNIFSGQAWQERELVCVSGQTWQEREFVCFSGQTWQKREPTNFYYD